MNPKTIMNPKSSTKTLESLFSQDEQLKETEEILSSISYCTESPSDQELKRDKLIKILSALKPPKIKPRILDDRVMTSALMNMISSNLLRPLPPPSKPPAIASDAELWPNENDAVLKLSKLWSNLQIVYEILLRLVANSDPKSLGSHVDQDFLGRLLARFGSEDPRERESLKNVYHRIYLRFPSRRAFMRKSMRNALLSHLDGDETGLGSGVGEVLEVCGSIISGFLVPLKEEHKLFLMRVLVPLRKGKDVRGYHRQLAYCLSQFVLKDPSLGGVVVRGVFKYWPLCDSEKELLFIGELEELVEIIDTDQYRKLALPLCARITKCLTSWNSQVAERALYVWNNEHFVKMAQLAMEEVYPIVVKGMEKNLTSHWSKNIRQLTENVKAMLQEMEPILYSKCLRDIKQRDHDAREAVLKRKEKWDKIEIVAAKNQHLLQQQSPYICVSH